MKIKGVKTGNEHFPSTMSAPHGQGFGLFVSLTALCQVPRAVWGTWECSISACGINELAVNSECEVQRVWGESQGESLVYCVPRYLAQEGRCQQRGDEVPAEQSELERHGEGGCHAHCFLWLDREEGCPLTPAGHSRWVLSSLGMERRIMPGRFETLLVRAKSNPHTRSFEKWSGQT